jgi:hypothetical protein
MTAIRQMARYPKLATRRERPRFASDKDAEVELMSGSRYSFQYAEAFARIDITCHLSPSCERGLMTSSPRGPFPVAILGFQLFSRRPWTAPLIVRQAFRRRVEIFPGAATSAVDLKGAATNR